MNKFIWSLISLLVFTSSCQQIESFFKKEEVDPNLARTYHDNGRIMSEMRLDEQRNRHGLAKQFFETGKLKSEIHYKHGDKERAVQYYENGNVQMEFLYKDGLKHGKRTRYWENGKIQSILEYDKDRPKKGLIEYNKKGQKIGKYPELIVKHLDRLDSHGEYRVDIYFSSNPGRGTFYLGKLKNGVLPLGLTKLPRRNYKGQIIYNPYPGTFIMEKLSVIGRYKTAYGNTYLVEKELNIAIDF
jgi:hypothetical protein